MSRFKSRARDFCQIFEGFGFGFEKFGLGKKVSVSVSVKILVSPFSVVQIDWRVEVAIPPKRTKSILLINQSCT